MNPMRRKTFDQINALVNAGKVQAAESEARAWLPGDPNDPNVLGNVGAIFIDAGSYSDRAALIREGVELTRRAISVTPSDSLTYNLANGLLSLVPSSPESYLTVRFDSELAEVCSLYYTAIDRFPSTRPEPRFNFAAALQRAGRAMEAVDLVRETLVVHPEHGRGWATLGDSLWGVWAYNVRYPDLLQDAMGAYRLALAYETEDQPFRKRIQDHLLQARKLLNTVTTPPHPELLDIDRTAESLLYEVDPWDEHLPAFIWKSGLGLNLCSGCRVDSPTAYDRHPLRGVLVDPKEKSSAERLPAEINTLVQGFVGARALLWLSRAQDAAQLEVVSWPVKGLAFSRRSALLAAAFREAYGVLDRIAEALNARFSISKGNISFDQLFFEKKSGVRYFREKVAWPESVGLRALLYLSESFESDGGRFRELRKLRNELQHSMVLPGRLPESNTWPWRAISDAELENETLRLLRLVRAAVFYCCECLQTIEHRKLAEAEAQGKPVARGKSRAVARH